jgi:hypothetical protein
LCETTCGESKGIYCEKHKLDNMVNVKSKTCEYEDCPTLPVYNYKGESKGIYCAKHKLDDMINVIDKTCEYNNCLKRPTFNYKGESKGIYCKKHKLDKMIDVKNKTCEYENCNTQASYGKLFNPKIHCGRHRNNNEFLYNNPKCEEDGCKIKPFYSDDNYPKRCEDHQIDGDFNIVETECKSCGLSEFINTEIGYCNSCYDHIINHVDMAKENKVGDMLEANLVQFYSSNKKPIIKKRQKKKETRILNVLSDEQIELVSHDKRVENGCHAFRPDFIIDYDSLICILEVDENQHQSYDPDCEMSRMINIHEDLGGIPVLFIRYNPDSYKDKKGMLTRGASSKREKFLLEYIRGVENRIKMNEVWDGCHCGVVYLYYDGFDQTSVEIEEIDTMQYAK